MTEDILREFEYATGTTGHSVYTMINDHADSLEKIEFIMGVERATGVEIPDIELPELHSILDVVNYVKQQKKSN